MVTLRRYAPFILSVFIFAGVTIVFFVATFHWFFLTVVWPLILYGWSYLSPTTINNFVICPLMSVLYSVILFFPLFLFGLTRKKNLVYSAIAFDIVCYFYVFYVWCPIF